MQIVSVVGARPQFVKLAVVRRAMAAREGWEHRIIHTGQHYDPSMSSVFFEELGIPCPDYDLDVGSGSEGEQTGKMLKRLEPVPAHDTPDWVLLYGDTNSTSAGAVIASKLMFRTAYIEASYRRGMPEEINRVAAGHLSDLLLCPTAVAAEKLRKEGLADRAVLDVLYDGAIQYRDAAERRGGPLADTWHLGEFAHGTDGAAIWSSAVTICSSLSEGPEQCSDDYRTCS